MAAPHPKRRARDDDDDTMADPSAPYVFDAPFSIDVKGLESMTSLERCLDEIQEVTRGDAVHREMEIYNLQTAARGYTDHDERECAWVFDGTASDWITRKADAELMIECTATSTQAIHMLSAHLSSRAPLDPRLYSMAVCYEEDLVGVMTDVVPSAAKPIWKAAAASIDTLVWSLLRLITRVGREQNLRLIPGFYNMNLRRQAVRYDVPLHHRIAIAAAYLSTMVDSMYQWGAACNSEIDKGVETWHPQIRDALSRVDRSVWNTTLEQLFSAPSV